MDAIGAAGNADHANAATQMGAKQQNGLPVDHARAGVVDGHHLLLRFPPHIVDLMPCQDRIPDVAQDGVLQRHLPVGTAAGLDGPLHHLFVSAGSRPVHERLPSIAQRQIRQRAPQQSWS